MADTTVPPPVQDAITPDVRAAMRAYLQRSEVRLSTMHRVAGIFLNGAGLLFLFPLLFKDAVRELANLLFKYTGSASTYSGLLLLVPFLISMAIPIYALWSLIKDLVYFYFTVYRPGFPTNLFHPRFALAAIAFSTDEAPAVVKEEIMRREYGSSLRLFASPINKSTEQYFDEVYRVYGKSIIPKTRHPEILRQIGIFDDLKEAEYAEVDHLNTALGLASFLDRPLIDEVARMEITMTRHALLLRRLVIRYMKALLALIWTTLISFGVISLIGALSTYQTENSLLNLDYLALGAIALSYVVWSISLPWVVYLPNYWLHQMTDYMKEHVRDTELVHFEQVITLACIVAGIFALIVMYFQWRAALG